MSRRGLAGPAWLLAILLLGPAQARDGGPDADAGPAAGPDAGPRDQGLPDAVAPDPARLAQLVSLADDAMANLARQRNREGLAAFQAKDHPTALRHLTEARDLAPNDPEIANNLGYLYESLGDPEAADRWYRETLRLAPRRAVAWLNLGDLLAAAGTPAALAEAADAFARARRLRGNDWKIIRRQARVASQRGLLPEAERRYAEAGAAGGRDAGLSLEIGDFYRELGRSDEALGWYRRVGDGPRAAEAAQRIRAVQVDLQARRYGWSAASAEIPAGARKRLERARAAAGQGDAAAAEALLREAIAQAPLYAAAHGALGGQLAAKGAVAEAELALLRAVVLDGSDAQVLATLGDLLARQGRPAEAALFLGRAVEQRPEWLALQLRLARAWQAAGELPRALRQVELYLAALPEDAPAEEARALQASLRDRLPRADADPAEAPADPQAPGPALARARGALAAGEPGKAMAALAGLRDTPAVLNLRGRILLASGQLAAAEEAFAASLALEPAQAEVWEQRAVVARGQGAPGAARAWLLRAEHLGSPTAALSLARLDAARGDGPWPDWVLDLSRLNSLWAAQGRLETYLAAGAPGGQADDAGALLRELRRRQRAAVMAAVAGLASLGLLLGGGLRRIWGGADLAALLARHPDTGPEVQQILSAIRHEVLKHNTLVLTGLVDALERGDPVGEQAAWCRRSLLGAPGEGGAGSAWARLQDYATRLGRLGRARGLRLNLRRKDRALSALLAGFKTLRRAASLLDRAETLSRLQRERLLRALRRAAQALNVEGYEGVRALLDRLRVLQVDRALLQALFERTRNEPAFAQARLAPLSLDDPDQVLPVCVVVPRYAFDDILHNLLRNALQSSLSHCPAGAPVHIGLGLRLETDPITGLQRLALAIKDRSPQRLTPEQLRGRYIEAGLGLTADLVSRHEGSLDVEEAAPPWRKAVVLRLPHHDTEEERADG